MDASQAIGVLREGLIDSFGKQDIDGLLTYVAPDVVVTWQNGEVCHGPAEVKAYYERMMKGKEPIVAKITADPKVDGRQIYSDWAVSFGHMNDHFLLTDGSDLPLNSRFTATISRQGDRWLITAFHVSANLFDNPVLGYAAKKGATYGAMAGAGGRAGDRRYYRRLVGAPRQVHVENVSSGHSMPSAPLTPEDHDALDRAREWRPHISFRI